MQLGSACLVNMQLDS